jgi:diguanylate cyclase (GGDEF)-like protein/PAS domain S-box-containing protein
MYGYGETAAEHWHYVLNATAFVIISLLTPLGFVLRKERIRLGLEEELRHAAVVFENILDGVMITDRKQRIVAVNRSFMEITGYAAADVLGKSPGILKSERHDKVFYDRIRQSLSESGHWRGEIWNRKKNGEPFPVWESISEVRDGEGNTSHYVAVFSDISSIKRTQEELAHLANHDPLTGLPNRNLFQDRLEHALQGNRRNDENCAVIFMDLDRFKNVNDTLGHPAGDQLLCRMARRLLDCVRETDTVARLGGDEFILLLERIGGDACAERVAHKIQEALAKPVEVNGHEVFISASIGISVYPRDGKQGTELIRNADAAMYRAKELGRGKCQFYTAELTHTAFEHFTLESSLRRAMERGEFLVCYQPQVSLKSGEVVGAEALIRWQRPGEGMVLPDRFIPVLEQTGLIVPVFEWLLRHAGEAWCGLVADDLPRLTVNVSNAQFRQGDLVGMVSRVLQATGLEARLLELEITESALIQDPDAAARHLEALHAMGVRIAVDDFGTGYSSLGYLRRFPIDVVKVDRSFVRDITSDTQDTALVSAIFKMCHVLDLESVAEGVETVPQLALLREQGCDTVQGYLFARPLPLDDLRDFLVVRGRHRGALLQAPLNYRAAG